MVTQASNQSAFGNSSGGAFGSSSGAFGSSAPGVFGNVQPNQQAKIPGSEQESPTGSTIMDTLSTMVKGPPPQAQQPPTSEVNPEIKTMNSFGDVLEPAKKNPFGNVAESEPEVPEAAGPEKKSDDSTAGGPHNPEVRPNPFGGVVQNYKQPAK